MSAKVRWILHLDFAEVARIDAQSFRFAWDIDDLRAMISAPRHCYGIAVEEPERGEVVGYLFYERLRRHIRLHRIAVTRGYRRNGYGTQLIHEMIKRLPTGFPQQKCLVINVRETNLVAQLWLKAIGFTAIGIHPNYYEYSTDEDAFVFTYLPSD